MNIQFEKPNFAELRKDGFMPVDMHTHTHASDGFMTVKQAINTASKLGVGLAITDHNKISSSLSAIKNTKNIMIIPGMELNSAEKKDILIYFYNVKEMEEFYNKHIKHKLKIWGQTSKVPLNSIAEITEDYNCVLSGAHPCGIAHKNLQRHHNKKNVDPLLKKMDAFEVFNGGIFRKNNYAALKWAKEYDKGFTAGSDAHNFFSIGSGVSCANAETAESFLEEVAKKKNFVVGKEAHLLDKFATGTAIFTMNIPVVSNIIKQSFILSEDYNSRYQRY